MRASLVLCVVLAGCSIGNSERDFLCAAQDGLPCRSIGEVDGTAGSSGTPLPEDPRDTRAKTITTPPLLGGKSKAGGAAPSVSSGGVPYQSARYRIPEKTGRLWIAPFRDDAEILHEGTFVHFVIREAEWGQR